MSNIQMGRTPDEQAKDGEIIRTNRGDLATALEQLLAGFTDQETMIEKLIELGMIKEGEGGNLAEMQQKSQEELVAVVQGAIDEIRNSQPALARTQTSGAVRAVTETAQEHPEAVRKMIEDMQRTANETNKFYNFGSMEAMTAALQSLREETIQAIAEFVEKIGYRRTEISFPILVNSEDGTSYFLTESAPSAKNVNINAAQAKVLVEGWGGLSSPNKEQWELLKKLGLVDTRDIFWEWLPSESEATDADGPWYGSVSSSFALPLAANNATAYGGVRALRNVPKA